jgi:sarcosine oxidase
MGSATAWALARRGVDVVLLERFGPGHAHGAPHGRARIYRSTYAQPHHQALVAEARTLWRELEERRPVRPGRARPAGVMTHADRPADA